MKTAIPMPVRGQGFSLVEVLVALLVLSVGLLGLAQMNAKGLRFTQDARSVGLAANLAADMAERIRANAEGAEAGHYDSITGTELAPGCSVCTAEQRADTDAAQWAEQIEASLGDTASGTVAGAGGMYTITVTWTGTQDASLRRGAQTYDLVFRP